MRSPYRALLAATSLAVAACSHAAPPPAAPDPPKPAASAEPPPAPAGHLVRGEVDRVLATPGLGPAWLLRRVMREEVIRNDGKFTGWRLVGLPDEWRDIDVKPGDVVIRVNGLPLETPDEGWEAWKSVAKSPDLTIEVMRDGAAKRIVIPIDGAPSAETVKLLNREPGPQRPAQNQRGSIVLGGQTPAPTEDDAY